LIKKRHENICTINTVDLLISEMGYKAIVIICILNEEINNLMGLSIHYSGRFGNPDLLQAMIEEVEDIVKVYKWRYHIYHTQFPTAGFTSNGHDGKVYGISFTPPECETVTVCFLSNGRMSCSSLLEFYGDSNDEKSQEYLYMPSVKTQYAGWQTHLFILKLLKYITAKYFVEFKMQDEGDYWETSNEELLKQNFSRYNKMLDSVCIAFESFPVKEGETMEEYIERMMEFVNRKFEKG
jgi:phage pi2 protein 07